VALTLFDSTEGLLFLCLSPSSGEFRFLFRCSRKPSSGPLEASATAEGTGAEQGSLVHSAPRCMCHTGHCINVSPPVLCTDFLIFVRTFYNILPRCTIRNLPRGGSCQVSDSSQDVVYLVKDYVGLWVLCHNVFLPSAERMTLIQPQMYDKVLHLLPLHFSSVYQSM
jgi:hypothetical protein